MAVLCKSLILFRGLYPNTCLCSMESVGSQQTKLILSFFYGSIALWPVSNVWNVCGKMFTAKVPRSITISLGRRLELVFLTMLRALSFFWKKWWPSSLARFSDLTCKFPAPKKSGWKTTDFAGTQWIPAPSDALSDAAWVIRSLWACFPICSTRTAMPASEALL